MIIEKISNRNYPIVDVLTGGKLKISTDLEKKMGQDLYSSAKDLLKENHDFKYITAPFLNAFCKSRKSLGNLRLMDFLKSQKPTVLINISELHPLLSIVYRVFEVDNEPIRGCLIYVIYDGVLVGFMTVKSDYSVHENDDNSELAISIDDDFSKHIYFSSQGCYSELEKMRNAVGMQIFWDTVDLSLFIKYAQVETKTVGANKRYKDINCKYTNETNSDITFLDSTWFTNLVKSEGFNVRGHFRMQPKKKDGEWTKELIWISEFEKSGYNRKAKKISYEVQ